MITKLSKSIKRDVDTYNYSLFSTLIDNINKNLIIPSLKIAGNKMISTKIDTLISVLSIATIIYLNRNKDNIDKTYRTLLTKIVPLFAFYNSYQAFINNLDKFKLDVVERNKSRVYDIINMFVFAFISYYVTNQVDKNIDLLTEKYSETFKKIDSFIAPSKIKSTFAQTVNLVDSIFTVFLFSYYISTVGIYIYFKMVAEKEDINYSDIQLKAFVRTLLNEFTFLSLAGLEHIESRELTTKIKSASDMSKIINSEETAKAIKNIIATKPLDTNYDKIYANKPAIKKAKSSQLTTKQKHLLANHNLIAILDDDTIYYNTNADMYLVKIFQECVMDVANSVYEKFGRNYFRQIITNIEFFTKKDTKMCGVINGYSSRDSLTIIASYNQYTCKDDLEGFKKEIRGVLAHEFAHSYLFHRYHFRSMILSISTNKWYRLTPSSTIWVSVLADYICFLYERQNELESDSLAIEILGNEDMIYFLRKTLEREGEQNASLLRAHGTLEQRILSAKHTYEMLLSKQKQDNQSN